MINLAKDVSQKVNKNIDQRFKILVAYRYIYLYLTIFIHIGELINSISVVPYGKISPFHHL